MKEILNEIKLVRKHLLIWSVAGAALLGTLTFGGCNMPEMDEIIPDLQAEKDDDPDEKFDFIARNNSVSLMGDEQEKPELVGASDGTKEAKEIKEQASKLSEKPKPETQKMEEVVVRDDPKFPGARKSRFYEDFILLDADSPIQVSMHFSSAPILDVLSAFADVLEFNFTADSDLRGTVTLNLNSTMTRRELWEAFDRMLQLSNAAAFKEGQLLRITTSAKLARQDDLRIDGVGSGNSEVVLCSLKYISAKEVINQLKAFLTPSGSLQEGSTANVVLICDSSDNVPKLRSILEVLDNPGRKMWPRAVIPCTNVLPSKIAADISEILPVIGFTVSTASSRNDTAGAVYVSSVDRLQLLVVSAATDEVITMLREWVALLDTADSAEEERVYVYKVANSKAANLAQALSVIFTTQGSSLTVDTSSGNSRTQQITTQTTRNTSTSNSGSATFSRAGTNNDLNTSTTLDSSIFSTPVRVFADGINNRLVIRTTPRTYNMMKALLERLDTVPAQVLLQVLIVEVNLNNGNDFGVEFNNTGGGNSVATDIGSDYGLMATQELEGGTKIALTDPDNPDQNFAYIRALATRNKVKVISSPSLLVSSNTEAQIQVGDEVPLVTGSVTNSQALSGVTNSYTYRNTGIIMTMTPQVTSSDLIVLAIKQEVSEAVRNTITTVSDTPVIQQRTIETEMTIGNGRTMIMGGIIQEKLKDNLDSIPLISDIPFLGRVFGNTEESTSRTEMLVLVTGYIVDEKGKVEDMIQRYNDAVKELSKFESNIAETHAADLVREAKIRKDKAEAAAQKAAAKEAEEQAAAVKSTDAKVEAKPAEAVKPAPAPATEVAAVKSTDAKVEAKPAEAVKPAPAPATAATPEKKDK